MPKLDAKIAAAELKLKQMKTKQRQAEARKRSLAAKNQRSQELRRKILAGAIVLAKVEAGELPKAQFRHWLEESITRADDRALFELPIPESLAERKSPHTLSDQSERLSDVRLSAAPAAGDQMSSV
jgi:hypothetical protein